MERTPNMQESLPKLAASKRPCDRHCPPHKQQLVQACVRFTVNMPRERVYTYYTAGVATIDYTERRRSVHETQQLVVSPTGGCSMSVTGTVRSSTSEESWFTDPSCGVPRGSEASLAEEAGSERNSKQTLHRSAILFFSVSSVRLGPALG